MSRVPDTTRILAALSRVGVPMRADEVAMAIGSDDVDEVTTDLMRLRRQGRVVRDGERGNRVTGTRRVWSLPDKPAHMTTAERILAMLDEPRRTAQIAAAIGISEKSTRAELNRLRMLGRVDYVTGPHGPEWRRAEPSNVVPLRPRPVAPLRMLPVVRRDDCVHEPECSFAAAKAWPDHEGGLTCPWECGDYEKAPRRAVSHPSNWMGGEG